jgi:hypothetical protein
MMNDELLSILNKTMARITHDSFNSSADCQRALEQCLENWIEDRKSEGIAAIKDIVANYNLRASGDANTTTNAASVSTEPTTRAATTDTAIQTDSTTTSNALNASFKPLHNEDLVFPFEESPLQFPQRQAHISSEMDDSSEDVDRNTEDMDDDNQDKNDDDLENEVPDSYLPSNSNYGSLPINIAAPFGQGNGNAAIKRGVKVNTSNHGKVPFEPPHEYAARTYQERTIFERPSVSARKQSLI